LIKSVRNHETVPLISPLIKNMKAKRLTNEEYLAWKRCVPFLYDWFVNHHLELPSLACSWGPVTAELDAHRFKQRLYLSQQTLEKSPNKLFISEVEVCRPRYCTGEKIAAWVDQKPNNRFVSKPINSITHPGEVNRIVELPTHPDIIGTHTDGPDVYIWNLQTHPNRTEKVKSTMQPSVPDLVLTGHTKDASFALAAARTAPMVASGGHDKNVLIWDLEDHATSISDRSFVLNRTEAEHLKARITLTGHRDTVEGVVFCPGDHTKLASVGDDGALLLWDTNAPSQAPVSNVQNAHKQGIDVHDVSWSALQRELLVTCGQDGSIRVWDTRKLTGGPLHDFNHHTGAVVRVEWSPSVTGVFASAGQDNMLCIWDIASNDGGGKEQLNKAAKKLAKFSTPKELAFLHAGHKTEIVDFQWNPHDPWTIASVSQDTWGPRGKGGVFHGTLQMWRISDMIYRPEEDIIREMEANKEYILTGDVTKLKTASSGGITNGNQCEQGGGHRPGGGEGGGVQREQKQ